MTVTINNLQSDVVAVRPSLGVSVGTRTALRKLYGSAVVLLFLFATFGTILPDSKTATDVGLYTSPVAKYTGLHQQWGLFSPNPSSIEYGMFAEVFFTNGETATWEPATPGSLNSPRKERWRKWVARVGDETSEQQWAGTAAFIAQQFESDEVVRVRLITTWTPVPDPEEPPQPRQQSELAFYQWNVLTQTGEVFDAWE